MILTGDLPAEVFSGAFGVAPAAPEPLLMPFTAAWEHGPTEGLTVKITRDGSMQQSHRDRVLCAAATRAAADKCDAGSTSYNYDPFGRLNTITIAGTTDKTLERYGYDGFDRTVSHRKYDPATGAVKSSETKGFDPLDRTVQQTVQAGTSPAKTTTFTYLGLSEQVVSEQQPDAGGAAKTTASYTYGPTGERISQAKIPLTGGASETSYYGTNSHTDVETLTSETGNARSTYRYTGYGENDATGFTGKDKATATSGPEVEPYNPYRFNSKRWDPATGGYDMGFRGYSPGLNRFLTPRHLQRRPRRPQPRPRPLVNQPLRLRRRQPHHRHRIRWPLRRRP